MEGKHRLTDCCILNSWLRTWNMLLTLFSNQIIFSYSIYSEWLLHTFSFLLQSLLSSLHSQSIEVTQATTYPSTQLAESTHIMTPRIHELSFLPKVSSSVIHQSLSTLTYSGTTLAFEHVFTSHFKVNNNKLLLWPLFPSQPPLWNVSAPFTWKSI